MGLILDSVLIELLLAPLLPFWLFYMYMTSKYSYWKDRSICGPEPSFPFGTDSNPFWLRKSLSELYQDLYNKFREEKVVGMFQFRNPYLIVQDPELLKQIMTKDFNHFINRGMVDPELMTPVSRHLFNMEGESWKIMRHKLTPAFTSGKMKMMFFLMEACSDQFVTALEPLAERNEKIAIKDCIASFTTDVIASCAFGLESNSIQNPDNEFRKNGNKVFELPKHFKMLKIIIALMFPGLVKRFHILKPIPTESEDFFLKLVDDTVTYRENNNVIRNDFIDIMIKIKNNKSLADGETEFNNIDDQKNTANGGSGLTLEEMTAQALLFFAAGFETAASALSFCLYEISVKPEIQQKMRKEIDEVLLKHSGKANYQWLNDMTYMEAVICETLRRYTALPALNRQCTEDYKLPGIGLVIPKGMNIVIPIHGIHHDPEYYPDPYKFDPERFTDDKIKKKNNYTYIPFGEGPRMCIGNRFASMQMKMCLTMLLHRFQLSTTEDTQIPLAISTKHFVTTPASPIVLKISKRKE